MAAEPMVRRDYKDSLFCHIFGSESRKQNALDLYNALAGTAYTDPGDLELTTIEGVIFLGFKNDVSFLVGDELVLLEHQSTHNPNMPLRGLHYFSRLYAKLVELRGLDIYSPGRVPLPTPRYFVLYFGPDERPEREVMQLSESFTSGPGDLEVTATVLNCNEGRNAAIMRACEALRGYAHLLALARANRDMGMGLAEAVSAAVDCCIDEGALAEYLSEHRAEAKQMLFTIEDEERAMRVHWEAVGREAREHGMREGMEEGLKRGMAEGLEKGMERGRKAGRAEGRKAGRAEGLEQGRAETRNEIAANLRELGVDESVIQQAIGQASAGA